MWQTARTQHQIAAHRNLALYGDEALLVGYWRFNEGSALNTFDETGNGHDGELINMDPESDWVDVTASLAVGFSVTTGTTFNGVLPADDPEGNPLTFSIIADGTGGTATLADPAIGAFTYSPDPTTRANDTFTYQVHDGAADSNILTVNVVITHTLSAVADGPGTGLITSTPAGIDCGSDCTEDYDHGTILTLTATPDTGSIFIGWSAGGCSGTGDCNLTLNADTDVIATFDLDSDGDSMPDGWESENSLDPASDDASADGDGDDLSNSEEYQNATDPGNSDSDGDGMSDGWEVDNGLDPLADESADDADSDGYSNLQEYTSGTDPQDSGSLPIDPVADAGPDQTVAQGAGVTLNGLNSTDPDGTVDTWLWEQIAGSPVSLSDDAAAKTSFTALGAGTQALTFRLTVTDNHGLTHTDTCIVNVTAGQNEPPTADAGPDQSVEEGLTVILDGTGSSDSENGTPGAYLWTQTAGLPVTLSDPAAAGPSFVTPPVDADGVALSFQLTVTGSTGLKSMDAVSVTVTDNGITDYAGDVLPFVTCTGQVVGIQVTAGGELINLAWTDPNTLPDTADKPTDLIYGLIDMQIKVSQPGQAAAVAIHLSSPAPSGYTWCKYNATNAWSDLGAIAVFNDTRDQVTLTLTDGGLGDDDDGANGIIVDPSGLGLIPGGNGGGGTGGGGACFISTLTGR